MKTGAPSGVVRFEDIVAENAVMRALIAKARQVSRAGIRLILQGPTGTGKELLARAVHHGSERSKYPFFPINCGAIPETLAESEFFGYEKGSFTGAARRKRGCFELAHRGTLFLDEVTSLPLDLQAKLLRVLQDGRFLRMGGEEWVEVDLQIMAATNRDIRAEVKAGRFREDLFYRLGAVLLEIPALIDRREDVRALLQHFIRFWSEQRKKPLRGYSHAAWEFLSAYAWPGNVRQLELVVESLVAMEEGDEIDLRHFPSEILAIGHPDSSSASVARGVEEHRRIMEALSSAAGNRTKAARLLGISRPTLRARMETYGITVGIVSPGRVPAFRILPEAR
jgi:transcriptional regulator with PAS, ATPase and Fis domain